MYQRSTDKEVSQVENFQKGRGSDAGPSQGIIKKSESLHTHGLLLKPSLSDCGLCLGYTMHTVSGMTESSNFDILQHVPDEIVLSEVSRIICVAWIPQNLFMRACDAQYKVIMVGTQITIDH